MVKCYVKLNTNQGIITCPNLGEDGFCNKKIIKITEQCQCEELLKLLNAKPIEIIDGQFSEKE